MNAFPARFLWPRGEDDVAAAAAAVEPGSTAALLVWEDSWAAPFASAVRRAAGGQRADPSTGTARRDRGE